MPYRSLGRLPILKERIWKMPEEGTNIEDGTNIEEGINGILTKRREEARRGEVAALAQFKLSDEMDTDIEPWVIAAVVPLRRLRCH